RTTTLFYEGLASAKSPYESVNTGEVGQDWLVTPKVKLAAANNWLRFYESDEFSSNYGSIFMVKIATSNQTSHADFTNLIVYSESDISDSEWRLRELNLDNYAGQEVYIAFVHEQNFGDSWIIDNISITSEAATQDFAGGSGTEADPWQIATVEHLVNVKKYLGNTHNDKYFIQIANIDLNVSPWNAGEGWEPIGSGYGSYFHGHYNGDGFTISGLYANRPGVDNQGLFGMIENAEIKNMVLTGTQITGCSYIGALIGWSSGANITNCQVNSIVTANGDYMANVGGLAGYNSQTTMTNCSAEATVTGAFYVGGLVGNNNESTYTYCFSAGTVNCTTVEGGGLIGRNYTNSIIDQCYSTANVS
ncbi:MAG: hypothetical protein CVU93_03310, partial [Firmicutes bacterium HGW-Firmicutes-18]